MLKNYIEYLNDNPNNYWFKAKIYWWWWTPVKWQGWLVIFTYVLLLIIFSLEIKKYSTINEVSLYFLTPILLLTFLLIYICYKTGEKPRWQWWINKEKK